MKAVLLFLTIGCATSLCRAAHTTTTDDTRPQQQASQTALRASGRRAATKPKPEVVPLPKPVTPHRLTSNTENPAAGKTINAHRQPSGQRNSPTNASMRRNSNSFQQRSFRSPTLPRPVASTSNTARHHGPNPPVIGGPKNTNTTNTAALSGHALHHRP